MNISKALKRDRQRQKARHGHKVTGRSVFTIQAQIIKRGKKK